MQHLALYYYLYVQLLAATLLVNLMGFSKNRGLKEFLKMVTFMKNSKMSLLNSKLQKTFIFNWGSKKPHLWILLSHQKENWLFREYTRYKTHSFPRNSYESSWSCPQVEEYYNFELLDVFPHPAHGKLIQEGIPTRIFLL